MPDKINRYPSLGDRKKIALTIEKQTSELYRLYDIASIMMLKGEYRCASILYKNILNKRFGSREIFNNMGVAYALEGLKYASDEFKDLYKATKAISINIGMLDPLWEKNIIDSLIISKTYELPVIFDPVGAGATKYRTNFSKKIIKNVPHTKTSG